MKKDFLPYGHQSINQSDIQEVVKVLKSDWLTQGPIVEKFENALAEFCNVKYAAAVSSGTAALHLAYLALNLKKGDEVITTPLTFLATVNTLVHLAVKPVFCDVEKETLNIDPKEIEKKITKKTKAISIVDFAGHPCDIDKIKKIAKKYNLNIVEDAAHSLGALYKGKLVGGLADLTCLSFHPVKLITTGEGGAVLTNNRALYQKIKLLRQHGAEKKPKKGGWYYQVNQPGLNYRLTDIQSALGLSQLKRAREFIRKRRKIVQQYEKLFEGIEEIALPKEAPWAKSAWHIYPVRLNLEKLKVNRKTIFEQLRKQSIGIQVHYIPLHLQPFYQKAFSYEKGDFPEAESYYQRAITLPLFPAMKEQDIDRVAEVVKKIVKKWKTV